MSWFEEKQSAWLYRQAAQAESDVRLRALFNDLATAAERQAALWDRQAENFTPTTRARIVAALIRRFTPRRIRPILAAMKLRGLSAYDVRIHGQGHVMPTTLAEVGASHRGMGGGTLRAAVFGVNDGLVSNACLIMGVAGAGVSSQFVLTSGIAGLLAGALSMAAGEYVSMRAQREMYEYQIGLERDELAEYPDEEAEELALVYQARGMELSRAREFAQEMIRDPAHALDVLSREELGLNPDDLGSPWSAAGSSFLAFALGAAVPLLPFLLQLVQALQWSIVFSAGSLCMVGMVLSLFTGRNALIGGVRLLVIGGGAGFVSYFIGQWLGAAVF